MAPRRDIQVPVPIAAVARRPGDPTISDFKFTPATVTVHTGDTVTWTNSGPSAHTATASDGSFDSGTLAPGQSASHTFTQAGTFAYICKIHPFMHGTVVVLAAASSSTTTATGTPSSSTGSSASSTAAQSGSGTAAQASGGSRALPVTGIDLIATVCAGIGLLGAGAAVRRQVRKITTSGKTATSA